MMVGCSGSVDPKLLSRESSEVIEPPTSTAGEGGDATAAKEPDRPGKPRQTDPYAGHQLTGSPMVVEAVAITVNDEVITVSEILHSVHRQLTAAGKTKSKEQFARKAQEIIGQEIQRQIGEALIVGNATEEFGEAQMAYVDQLVADRIRDMVVANGGSQARLEQQIQAAGSTLDAARKALQRRMLSQLFYQMKVGNLGGPSRRELWRYYSEHPDQFTQPAKVKMQVLALPFSTFVSDDASTPTGTPREKAKAAAAAALERIHAGEGFTQVVTDCSKSPAFRSRQGGVWDHMAAGSFRETAVEEAAFSMPSGDVSDVIVGETGAFVVKTLDRLDKQVIPFEQAQDQIREAITEQRHREISRMGGGSPNRAFTLRRRRRCPRRRDRRGLRGRRPMRDA